MKNKINSLSTVIILMFFFVSCNKTSNLSNGTFFVQDIANNPEKSQIEKEALGLLLNYESTNKNDCNFYDVELSDTAGKDRAITLTYEMESIRGEGWTWLEGTYKPEEIKRNKSIIAKNGDNHPLSFNNDHVGACESPVSRYPFAAVTNGKIGIGIGIDMDYPAVFRYGFDGVKGKFYIAYDLGLAPENNKVKLKFVTFTFDPKWGFRGALARYYEIFPEKFICNVPSPKQGLWMPFTKISELENWEDFGFRFTEETNEIKWDNENKMLNFKYIEPLSYWMPMDKKRLPNKALFSDPAKYKEAEFAAIQEYMKEGESLSDTEKNHDRKAWAKSVKASVCYNADGTPYHGVTEMPWCVGVLWGMNSMPGIEGEYTDFKLKWNQEKSDKIFGNPKKDGVVDGMYMDSAEGFVGYLDFNRAHFSAATTPLTFGRFARKPALFRGLIVYEFIRAVAKDVHGMNKLMMANHTPSELCWLAPLLDVMGTETDWNPNNKWTPMPIEDMFFRRAMCKTKPYCFLQNSNFDEFSYELMEKYMKRSIAFGMSPGCFSHNAADDRYFKNPDLYNRDRELFKKYVPLCNLIAEAGWEAIPNAYSSDDKIHIERFGSSYLTIFNTSQEKRTVKIILDGIEANNSIELVGERPIEWENKSTELTLEGEDVAVIELNGK